MNEKFFSLPQEKQQAIINGALEVFSKYEYTRASTDLMAAKAGISKGLLFYYFKNKRTLYSFLVDYVAQSMEKEMIDEKFWQITDFFELMEYTVRKKAEILKKNPYLMDFSMKSFYTEKEEISQDMKNYMQMHIKDLFATYFPNVNMGKFREEVGPEDVIQMILWMSDGYLHQLQMKGQELDLDAMMEIYENWLGMLKKIAYKEEYLEL